MITRLSIRNFKSIKSLDLDCRRVNVFIGEPNAGKSNVLESLGLLSFTAHGNPETFDKFVRQEHIGNLFYDDLIEQPLTIFGRRQDGAKDSSFGLTLEFSHDEFIAKIEPGNYTSPAFTSNFQDIYQMNNWGEFSFVRFYRYVEMDSFPALQADHLLPPNGANLFSLIKARKEMRQYVADLFGSFGFRPMLKVHDHKIEMAKDLGELLYSYPYVTISDTLRRMIFYTAAIKSSKESTLVFEEPESNSFPFYTKDLAERIGRDTGKNQYFISTHNPYFLEPLVEKTPEKDLAVFLTHFKDYETHARCLSGDEISELLEMDPFLNLDRYVR